MRGGRLEVGTRRWHQAVSGELGLLGRAGTASWETQELLPRCCNTETPNPTLLH